MKLLLLVITFFLSSHFFIDLVFADAKVRYSASTGDTNAYVWFSGTVSDDWMASLYESSGDATSSSGAVVAYVPLMPTDTEYSTVSVPANLPIIASGALLKIKLFVLNSSGSEMYLHAATGSGSSFSTIKLSTLSDTALESIPISSTGSNQEMDVLLDFTSTTVGSLCAITDADCSSSMKRLVYFFLNTEQYDMDKTITVDSSNHKDGVYFNFYFSNAINSDATYTPSISNVANGDGRATLTFTGKTISDYAKTMVVSCSSPVASSQTYSDAITGGEIVALEATSINDQITVKNLNNDLGRPYYLAVGFMNKYQFVTPFSVTAEASPQAIDTFLKKQACYLLSAGFQEEHFVIDYFKNFRDSYLKKFYLGRLFIDYYYETAPKYAPYIYKSKIASFLTRMVGYALYYLANVLTNFFTLFFLVIFSIIIIKLRLRRYLNDKQSLEIVRKR